MTSGAFAASKLAIQARESAVSFSSSLTDAAKGFEAAGAALQKGNTSMRDVALRPTAVVADGTFPSADDLVQGFGMKAGNISPSGVTAFATKLRHRQARIAAMAGQFASLASVTTAVGVIIKENRNRRTILIAHPFRAWRKVVRPRSLTVCLETSGDCWYRVLLSVLVRSASGAVT
jgi:hypothetical protein